MTKEDYLLEQLEKLRLVSEGFIADKVSKYLLRIYLTHNKNAIKEVFKNELI